MNFLQQQQKHQISLPIAQQQQVPEDNANAAPDMEGWLYKQASKYKKWNKRWFVLKGPNLFYFKSPKVRLSLYCVTDTKYHIGYSNEGYYQFTRISNHCR